MVDGVKANYDKLLDKFNTVSASAETLQRTHQGLKDTYEQMIQTRNDRIKELEQQLDPKKPDTDTE
jgi:hypothetical protein